MPDDLQATLWAESPMFFNPTNMDIDAKGRVWVTEAVNYRNYNNDSTRELHHPGGDRVMILEDTNHDGKADVSKVFVQDADLIAPLGIGVIGNKIYVSCSPNLIVYTDDDGDDKPDHKEILLTGFGGKDHDHALHALIGGPDGHLYFNVGNAGPHIVKTKSGWTLRAGSLYTGGSPYNLVNHGNMKSDDGKIYVGGLAMRTDKDAISLKVMGHNFRNAYELTIDSKGDMWQNDNDDQVLTCRTTWLMEGGNAGYFSSDGTRFWQADQRPGQSIFTAHWHQDDPGVIPAGDNFGPGSPTGIAVNEGDGLGDKYRGMLLSADAGRNVIFAYRPKKQLSGFDLSDRTNLIASLSRDNSTYVWNDMVSNQQKDKWFRPSDVAIGTDGAIYIADWYDPVVGGHLMKDSVGYGRIYRITLKDKNPIAPDLDFSTVTGQIEAFKSPAINVRYFAFQQLMKQGEAVADEVGKLVYAENPYLRARAIWLLAHCGGKGKKMVENLFRDGDENNRAVAFRAMRQVANDIVPYATILASDPSPFVRREVVIAMRDLPYWKMKPVLLQLIKNFDGEDRWYLEALGHSLEGNEADLYEEISKLYSIRSTSAANWDKRFTSLAWRLHPASSVNDLKTWATSPGISDKDRTRAITALAFIKTSSAANAMVELKNSPLKEVAEQAMYWLSFRHGNDWFSLLNWNKINIDPEHERRLIQMQVLKSKILDPHLPADEKKWNAGQMSADSIGGQMLLGLLSEKKLPEEIYPVVQEKIFENPDQAVRVQAALYFKKEVAEQSFSAAEISKMHFSAEQGKKMFAKNCMSCHKIASEGKEIGPELTTIGKKYDRIALLDAIINPGEGIVFGYEAWLINTKKGESFFGFLVAAGPQTVVIKDISGEKHVIVVTDITSRQKQTRSLMPEPASLGLSNQDLSDISGYLETLGK